MNTSAGRPCTLRVPRVKLNSWNFPLSSAERTRVALFVCVVLAWEKVVTKTVASAPSSPTRTIQGVCPSLALVAVVVVVVVAVAVAVALAFAMLEESTTATGEWERCLQQYFRHVARGR